MTFLPGDHIFIRRGGLAGKTLVKHHAIVVNTLGVDTVEIVEHGVYNRKDGTKKWVAGMDLLHDEVGEVKRRTIDLKQEPGWTVAENLADPFQPQAIVERALFILDNASILPEYNLTYCNGECVARWCKTGKFESSQASKLYDKVGSAIADKMASAVDTSGQAVSRAIAPKPNDEDVPVEGKSSKISDAQAKASGALKQATEKVVGAVKAVGAMVGDRQQVVFDRWSKTNDLLDNAFAQQSATNKK